MQYYIIFLYYQMYLINFYFVFITSLFINKLAPYYFLFIKTTMSNIQLKEIKKNKYDVVTVCINLFVYLSNIFF